MPTEQSLLAELKRMRESATTSESDLIDPLHALAAWYCECRQPNRARPLVEEIWTLHKQAHGKTDRQTVEALSWLASILASSGKSDRAESLLAEMVVQLRTDTSLTLDRRATVWNQLVEVYYQRSNIAKAFKICREVVELMSDRKVRQEVKSSPACISQLNRARNNLGAMYLSRGEYREAQHAFTKNLKTAKRLPPGELNLVSQQFLIAQQLSNLAVVMRLRGLIAKSERITILAIRKCHRATGYLNPLVAQGLSNLGIYRLQGGRPSSALSLFRKALRIRRNLHPKGHHQIIRSVQHLAEAHLAMGKHDKAERLLERTRILLEKQTPVDEILLAKTFCSLGHVYLELGQLATCERTLDRALQLQENVLGTAHSQIIPTLNGLGCLNTARGNYEAALTHHRRALKMAEKHLGPDHPDLAKTLLWIGENNLARGDVNEAQIVFDRALKIRESSLSAEHPLVAEVLVRHGRMALVQGQPARALSIAAQAKVMCQKAPECPPLALADVMAVGAEASVRLKRRRSIEVLSLEELKFREQVVGTEHATLLPAIKRLAFSYMDRNLFEKADSALRRGLAIAEKTSGATHEGCIHFAENMGHLSLAKQDFTEASHWMERTVKLCQRNYGDDAEEVADTLLKFASSLRTARRESDAEAFELRAIDVRNRNCHVLL